MEFLGEINTIQDMIEAYMEASRTAYLKQINHSALPKETTFAEYYLGELKDNYSNEEISFLLTELLRDVLACTYFGHHGSDAPFEGEYINNINPSIYSVTYAYNPITRFHDFITYENNKPILSWQSVTKGEDGEWINRQEVNINVPLNCNYVTDNGWTPLGGVIDELILCSVSYDEHDTISYEERNENNNNPKGTPSRALQQKYNLARSIGIDDPENSLPKLYEIVSKMNS